MNSQTARKLIRFFSGTGAIATIAIAIYAAQPWGDNDAYETLSDYLFLAVFVGWAISPYLLLDWSARRGLPDGMQGVLRVAVAGLITFWGIAVLVNAVFLKPDAQGALIFLFLPIFQWLVLAGAGLVLFMLRSGKAG